MNGIGMETTVHLQMGEIVAGFALLVGILWMFLKILAAQWRRELDLRFVNEAALRQERQAALAQRFASLDQHVHDEPHEWRVIHARIDEVVINTGELKGTLGALRTTLQLVQEHLMEGGT